MTGFVKRSWPGIILIIAAAIIPLIITNSYYLHLFIMGYIWAIAVYGLNLILGYTGQTCLGHAAFMGIGAYTTGLLNVKLEMSFWPAFILGCLFTALVGWVAGIISLRTRGHYFAIFTMCIGVMIYVIATRWDNLTGGMNGLIGISGPPPIGKVSFDSLQAQYYIVLLFLLAAIYVTGRIANSLLGRTLIAIKTSEGLAEVLGINVMRVKIFSFVLSTLFAGVAGSLFAGYVKFLGPQLCNVNVTFDMLLYLFVGGSGTIAGPLIGSLVVSSISESLQAVQSYRMVIFGPILILLITFFPKGLYGGYELLRNKLKLRKITDNDPEKVKVEV